MVRTNSMIVGELPINGQNSALIFENHRSRYKYTSPLPAGSGNRAIPNIGQVYGAFQIQEISESALQRKTNSSQKWADNKVYL